ncbi:MAG: hypothetical protein AAGN15_23820 [Cyanobacteria bacterium J06581_3]
MFAYLKPCQPAPGIATSPATDPFNSRPRRLGKWRRRWLSFAFGAIHTVALGIGLWGLPAGKQQPLETSVPATASDELWAYLGSEAFVQDQLAGQLAAAEQERLHAQQLRINAEENAENLLANAAQRARNETRSAIRRVEAIQLDATYVGAEQVIYGEAGGDVTLKFAARIQCKEGSFGETAIATPFDWRITPREVRNLETCFVSAHTPAGSPIGEVGEWGVAFFRME